MKKGLLIALMLCICGFVNAQRVFTLVYAISDDGFVNIRATPSASGKVVGQVYGMLHGLGNAEKIGQVDGWTKVKKDNVVGYARTKYLECQTWCYGSSPRIVAKKATPIYGEDFSGESATGVGGKLYTVPAGTIIADTYKSNSRYYILTSGHDNLYIPKSCVKPVHH